MKLKNMLLTTAVIAASITAVYAEDAAAGDKAAQPAAKSHKKFDKDCDGKLSDAEKAEKEKAFIKRFDKDGDGKLSDAEKAEAEKAKEKHGKRHHKKDGDASTTTTDAGGTTAK